MANGTTLRSGISGLASTDLNDTTPRLSKTMQARYIPIAESVTNRLCGRGKKMQANTIWKRYMKGAYVSRLPK